MPFSTDLIGSSLTIINTFLKPLISFPSWQGIHPSFLLSFLLQDHCNELKLNFKREMSHTKLLQCFYKMQEENLKASEVRIILIINDCP